MSGSARTVYLTTSMMSLNLISGLSVTCSFMRVEEILSRIHLELGSDVALAGMLSNLPITVSTESIRSALGYLIGEKDISMRISIFILIK